MLRSRVAKLSFNDDLGRQMSTTRSSPRPTSCPWLGPGHCLPRHHWPLWRPPISDRLFSLERLSIAVSFRPPRATNVSCPPFISSLSRHLAGSLPQCQRKPRRMSPPIAPSLEHLLTALHPGLPFMQGVAPPRRSSRPSRPPHRGRSSNTSGPSHAMLAAGRLPALPNPSLSRPARAPRTEAPTRRSSRTRLPPRRFSHPSPASTLSSGSARLSLDDGG